MCYDTRAYWCCLIQISENVSEMLCWELILSLVEGPVRQYYSIHYGQNCSFNTWLPKCDIQFRGGRGQPSKMSPCWWGPLSGHGPWRGIHLVEQWEDVASFLSNECRGGHCKACNVWSRARWCIVVFVSQIYSEDRCNCGTVRLIRRKHE